MMKSKVIIVSPLCCMSLFLRRWSLLSLMGLKAIKCFVLQNVKIGQRSRMNLNAHNYSLFSICHLCVVEEMITWVNLEA